MKLSNKFFLLPVSFFIVNSFLYSCQSLVESPKVVNGVIKNEVPNENETVDNVNNTPKNEADNTNSDDQVVETPDNNIDDMTGPSKENPVVEPPSVVSEVTDTINQSSSNSSGSSSSSSSVISNNQQTGNVSVTVNTSKPQGQGNVSIIIDTNKPSKV